MERLNEIIIFQAETAKYPTAINKPTVQFPSDSIYVAEKLANVRSELNSIILTNGTRS